MPMPKSVAAALNNGTWCDAVCRAHGGETAFVEGMWINRDPSPPFYPNAVTLGPRDMTSQLRSIQDLLDSGLPTPWSVKDSFCALDLAPLGFDVLFEAQWIGLRPEETLLVHDRLGSRWKRVASESELVMWEAAWSGQIDVAEASAPMTRAFPPVLLQDTNVAFLAERDGWVVAGIVANRSNDLSSEVVGISNLFLPAEGGEVHRAEAVAAARATFPGLPMVGYERGADLVHMQELGFEVLGPLRVWVTKG